MRNNIYIKPLEELHDSGYKFIEVGYVTPEGLNPIGRCSDVINFGFASMDKMPKDLNIDISADGTINLFSFSDNLEWKLPLGSNAMVVVKGN